MSRFLHPLHRSARARRPTRRLASLSLLALAMSLVFLASAAAAAETAPPPRSISDTAGPAALDASASSGADDAGNRWAGLVLTGGAARITGETVTVAARIPVLDFACPMVASPSFDRDADWLVAWRRTDVAPGTVVVSQAATSPLCTTDRVRVAVDRAKPAPSFSVSGDAAAAPTASPVPPGRIAPTATAVRPTATAIPPTATQLPPTATPPTTPNGSDNAGNHWAGLVLTAPMAVTSESVTVAVTTPTVAFQCPKVANADFSLNEQWNDMWQRTNVATGKLTVSQTTPLCTADRLRVAVDRAYPAPQFTVGGTAPPPTTVPPTATPLPPTSTPITKTATPVAGAVGTCDGVTDDTAAIQAALNKGGTVTVKAGACIISSTLRYGSSMTLQGQGQDVTTIRNRAGLNGAIMLQPVGLRVANFTVRNITLDAQATSNEDAKFTVNADATSYFLSDHVTYRHVMQMAVWTDGAGGTATDHLTVQNSIVTEAFGDGFSFFGQITDASILSNEVMHCMDDGIAFQEKVGYWGTQGYPTRITITGNYVHDCTQRNSWGSTANGINIFGSDSVTVNNNRVTNVVSDGLRLTGGVARRATNVHAYGNTVVNSGANYVAGSGVPAWCIHIDQSDSVDGGNNTVTPGSTGDVFRNINSTNVAGFPWSST
jgi:hypothetical protein